MSEMGFQMELSPSADRQLGGSDITVGPKLASHGHCGREPPPRAAHSSEPELQIRRPS